MARRSPVPPGGDPQKHPALTGGHVVIISGESPIYKQNMQGPQGHAALGQLLERRGFEYEPCSGKYNGARQPSYIVHVRNEGEDEQLKGIAKRMGQEAIVHSEGNQHQYIYTGGDDEGKATPPSSGLQWFGDQEPDDNYTTLYGASGEPVGHFSYVLDFGNPLVQHGKSQQFVEVPEAARAVLKSAVESYHGILLDLRKRETMQKYIVEQKRATTHAKPLSNDISAQHIATPSKPYSDNVVSKGEVSAAPAPLRKPPTSEAQRRLVHARAAEGEKWAEEWASEDRGGKLPERKTKKAEYNPTPSYQSSRDVTGPHSDGSSLSVNKPSHPFSEPARATTGGDIYKTENTMKLHDLMKAQAEKSRSQGEHGGSPNTSRLATDDARAARVKAGCACDAEKCTCGKMEKAVGSYGSIRTPRSDPRNAPPKKEEKPETTAGREESFYRRGEEMKKFGEFPASNKFSNKLADLKSKPVDPNPQSSPAAAGAKQVFAQRASTPVVKNSIFKREVAMDKAETNASISAHRNGGHIKLGKQEFYIDLKNASDPKKRLRETNPVTESKVPGGKETGWDSNGPKPKSVERSASGGDISANKPKAGPDQKNTAENSVVEGSVSASSGKNDLIEKAAAAWHARNPNGGLAKSFDPKSPQRPTPNHMALAGGKPPTPPPPAQVRDVKKAATSMAAPTTPKAPGMGSPKLAAAAPAKPPAAAPGGKPMGKALMPFSAQQDAARRDIGAQTPPAPAAVEPKAQAKPTSAYDPSLYAPPAGGVSSGLELAGPPPGLKPIARSSSPAMHRGIRGFAPMGKAELCKACGKDHKLGKCGA